MDSIRFLTDSTANIPEDWLEKYDIAMVPVYVVFGEKAYQDYFELPPQVFYEQLLARKAAGESLPTTSQPSPEDFRAAYQRIAAAGASDIISLHVTSRASGTCASAELASTMVEGVNVHVVDSATTSLLMAYMIFEAQQAVAKGGGPDAALAAIERVKAHSALIFTVSDIDHLESSGRTVGHEDAARAEISVKPIVSLEEGVPKAVGKERTQRAALKQVLALARARAAGSKITRLAVVNGNVAKRAQAWAPEAARALGFGGTPDVVDFGPALAVHFGPGLLGVGLVWC